MQERQQQTQQIIAMESDEQNQQEEQQLEFNKSSSIGQSCLLWVFLILIVSLVILGSLKIAFILQQNSIIIYGDYQQFQYPPLLNNTLKNGSNINNIDSIVEVLEESYRQVSLQKVTTQDVINAERLNNYHVGYSRSLRKIDYQNAKLRLSEILTHSIHDSSEINYRQFLQALTLLQLPTLPYQDLTSQKQQIIADQYEQYSKRWDFKEKQGEICAIMMLTRKGLISQNYYYAIRSLFQQQYSKFKIVVIDNTPQLGMQANVIGLLKELATNNTIVLDKINGDGLQGSAVYFALRKYCSGSQFTIILHDTGELIGSYAFSLLNQAHKIKQAPIVMSHYLLDVENVFQNLQGDFRYKVQLYRPYQNSSNPRYELYKTKYIKSYKTSILLTLPQSEFHNQNGFWYEYPFEARLQFAALQRVCGKHYILPEILYRLPKAGIERKQAIIDAQMGTTLNCIPQLTYKSVMISDEYETPQIKQFDHNMMDLKNISIFTPEELRDIALKFNGNHKKREKDLNGQISLLMDRNKISTNQNTKEELKAALNSLLTNNRTNVLDLDQKSVFVDYSTPSIYPLNKPNIAQEQRKAEERNADQIALKSNQAMKTQSTYFCILLTTENNQRDYSFFYSVQSLLKQQYGAYRLTIIDNGSRDKTLQLLNRYHNNLMHLQKKKVKLVGLQNTLPQAELLYYTVRKFCQSNEFLIAMKSGQQFIGTNVLKTLNEAHRQSRFLAVHSANVEQTSQHYKLNLNKSYPPQVLKQRNFRIQNFRFNPLRSFRVDLFLKIEKNDFKREEKWMNTTEFNISYAVLQMACQKIKYIDQVLYKVSNPNAGYPIYEKPKMKYDQHPTLHQPFRQADQIRSGVKAINESTRIQKRNSSNVGPNETKIIEQNGKSIISSPAQLEYKPKYQCLIENFLTINP